MTEIILGLLLLSHIVYHAWYVRGQERERSKMMRAFMSKNLQEYHASEIMEDVTKEQSESPLPDEVSIDELSQDSFEQIIENQTHG